MVYAYQRTITLAYSCRRILGSRYGRNRASVEPSQSVNCCPDRAKQQRKLFRPVTPLSIPSGSLTLPHGNFTLTFPYRTFTHYHISAPLSQDLCQRRPMPPNSKRSRRPTEPIRARILNAAAAAGIHGSKSDRSTESTNASGKRAYRPFTQSEQVLHLSRLSSDLGILCEMSHKPSVCIPICADLRDAHFLLTTSRDLNASIPRPETLRKLEVDAWKVVDALSR